MRFLYTALVLLISIAGCGQKSNQETNTNSNQLPADVSSEAFLKLHETLGELSGHPWYHGKNRKTLFSRRFWEDILDKLDSIDILKIDENLALHIADWQSYVEGVAELHQKYRDEVNRRLPYGDYEFMHDYVSEHNGEINMQQHNFKLRYQETIEELNSTSTNLSRAAKKIRVSISRLAGSELPLPPQLTISNISPNVR